MNQNHHSQTFIATLEEKQELDLRFIHFSFELKQPHRIEFKAGQHLLLNLELEGETRPYSIISDPDIKHGVEILVDRYPDGPGLKYLQSLNFGDQVEFKAPLGEFTIAQNNQEQALTMVGQGAGVAPLRSMVLDQLRNKQDQRKILFYWGLRLVDELIWEDDFTQLEKAFPNFDFHPVLSEPVKDWPLCRGKVKDCLQVHDLLPESGYYLCGSQEMIEDTIKVLKEKGVHLDKIHTEVYS